MNTYYVYLPQFISFDPTTLPGSSCYQLHSAGEETEAQAGLVTYPRGRLRSGVQTREAALYLAAVPFAPKPEMKFTGTLDKTEGKACAHR